MFDRILEQVAGRFGLSQDKAKQLLGALVALIFNPKRGGPAGFVQAFRDKGLGDVVGSWLGHGENQPINPSQLESVLGADTIGAIGQKLGLPPATVGNAAAALLPEAVNELSEHGDLPTNIGGLSERLRGWLGGLGEGLEGIGHWGAAAAGAGAAALGAGAIDVNQMAGAPESAGHRGGGAAAGSEPAGGAGGRSWLSWLVIIAAVIAAFLLYRGCQHRQAAPATTPAVESPAATTAPAATPPPAAQIDSKLALTRAGNHVRYEGVVDSETTKTSVIDALTQAFGAGNVTGQLNVDPNARTPGWLPALTGFLPQFTADGATLTFEGQRIDLSGQLADADKTGLLDKLKAAFGGFSFGGLFQGLGAAAEKTADAAATALSKLTPGQYNADELVKALNLMIIHFDTGSANISADSADILKRAAEAIKAAPAGTRIEVGGHTDNTGNAAANQRLSQQRAEAVKQRLTEHGVSAEQLTSKGYGQDRPVADNGTEEGRAQNRRIEFTVQK